MPSPTRFLLSLIGASLLVGCAQEVGDIDRVGTDLVRKSDLTEGEWYVRQTVSDVPATAGAVFVGLTFETEKVRFVVEQSNVMAVRSYEFNPGAGDSAAFVDGDVVDSGAVNDGRGTQEGQFYGQPVLGYPVARHSDVQRDYNVSTGEQNNIIEENTERDWQDREFMKVDWSVPSVSGLRFADFNFSPFGGFGEFVGEGEDGDDSVRYIYDEDGELEYFDFVTRSYINVDIPGCITLLQGSGIGDCGAQQVEIRTSFMRAPSADTDDYEPVIYDDVAMNRFGYFRTERLSYQRRRGATVEGRLLFANRHDIWEDSFQRDGDGNAVRGESGNRLALPFADRTPAPIVYHLSPNFPEALLQYAVGTAEGWDRSYRRAVAAAQNDGDVSGWEDVRPMYVLCNNPVSDTPVYPADSAYASDCGEAGDEVRIGDLRYNVMYWVTNPQIAGPLGYGPSAPDPETGEIISGTAYVYGASVDTYAQYAVDVIRFANGDLTPEDLGNPEYVRNQIRQGRNSAFDPRAVALADNPSLGSMELPVDPADLVQGLARERIDLIREDALDGRLDSLRSGPGWEERRIRMIEESELDLLGMTEELMAATPAQFDEEGLRMGQVNPTGAVSDDHISAARITNWMREMSPAVRSPREFSLGVNCVLGTDHLDDSIFGIAQHYDGRTDYDEIYLEIRGLIFKAVMEHEVGHTLGLRHNFGASWDALNYFDEYWDAKIEGYPSVDDAGEPVVQPFGSPVSIADVYGIATQTPAQITARMREYQYSSIMDYSSAFNTDFGGVGPYDDQAILFAYTTGVDRTALLEPNDPDYNRQEMGYVEVWENLPGDAYSILRSYEGARGIGYRHPLEQYHYSTIVEGMGNTPEEMLTSLRDRSYLRLPDVEFMIESNTPNRPVEVPYIFCSDEYRSTRQMCHTWDRGADPMEQTMDYVDRYRRYYYFDNYRRERLSWNTSSAASRAGGRIFNPLVQTYQRWLLTVAFSNSRPDSALDNSWTFAAFAGLNLVAEAITTPSSGYYYLDDDGVYRLYTSETDLSVYNEDTAAQIARESDFVIPEGEGRPKWSDYNSDEGYYYFQYPESSGHYLTSLFAMIALTSAEASAVGVELGQFEQNYVIPPYLIFEDELTALFNGTILQDPFLTGLSVNPVSDGYEFVHRPLLTLGLNDGTEMNPETGAPVPDGLELTAGHLDAGVGIPVDARPSFSEQIYALIWGMSSFTSNYSARYVDQGRIWELGSGQVPTLAPGFELLEFCDPNPAGTGKCYATMVPNDAPVPSLGAEFILRAQGFGTDYADALDAGLDGAADDALTEIDRLLTDLNIVMSVSDTFRQVF